MMRTSDVSKNLSPRFVFTGREHVVLTPAQRAARDRVRMRLENGEYRLRDCPCLCGNPHGFPVAETDRYGLPLQSVLCSECGLLRINPRPDQEALKEFYLKDYRDMYMNTVEVDDAHFLNMVARGRSLSPLLQVR